MLSSFYAAGTCRPPFPFGDMCNEACLLKSLNQVHVQRANVSREGAVLTVKPLQVLPPPAEAILARGRQQEDCFMQRRRCRQRAV